MNNNKLTNRIRTSLCSSLLPVMLGLLAGCSSGGDSTPPPPTINIASTSVVEGDIGTSALVFTVTASAAVGSGGATVQYATANGTATAGVDYTADTGTLSFTSGSTSATITILVNADTLLEADEVFTLTLSSPANLTLGTSSATGTITNDDVATFDGYFTGSASINSGTNISDLIGLAYNNRLMLFSRTGAQNVLYDISGITLVSGSNYNGTVAMYAGAAGAQSKTTTTANLSINGATITGTLNGTGLGTGTFTIVFDTANNVGATLARIDSYSSTLWQGNVYGYDIDGFDFSAREFNSRYSGQDNTTQNCAFISDLNIPDNQFNIYQLTHDIIDDLGLNTCLAPYASTGHTGLAAVITSSTTDDTLVFAFSNGSIALFAVLNH